MNHPSTIKTLGSPPQVEGFVTAGEAGQGVVETLGEALRRRLTAALADYDAAVSKCPVNNFAVERRTYGPNDRCSACGATASGSCGDAAAASYQLVFELRSALEQPA